MRKQQHFIYLLLLLFASGCADSIKTAIVKTRYVSAGETSHLPLQVDLAIEDNRVSANFSCKTAYGLEYAKSQAVAAALKKTGADIIYEPQYLIENTGSFFNVEVSGHPAHYKNFRQYSITSNSIDKSLPSQSASNSTKTITSPKQVTAEAPVIKKAAPAPVVPKETEVLKVEETAPAKTVVHDHTESFSAPAKSAEIAPESDKSPDVQADEKAKLKENDAPAGVVYHQVQPGETVSSIARDNGITIEQFNKWNYLPDGIEPGLNVVVRFSSAKKPAEAAKPAPVAKTTTAGGIKYHVLAYGETLYHLSQVYHVTVQQIKDWNNLKDNNVAVGFNLIVGK